MGSTLPFCFSVGRLQVGYPVYIKHQVQEVGSWKQRIKGEKRFSIEVKKWLTCKKREWFTKSFNFPYTKQIILYTEVYGDTSLLVDLSAQSLNAHKRHQILQHHGSTKIHAKEPQSMFWIATRLNILYRKSQINNWESVTYLLHLPGVFMQFHLLLFGWKKSFRITAVFYSQDWNPFF